MKRSYLTVLAAVAVLILGGGTFVRLRLLPREPARAAPPSQATALQQLSREALMSRQASFVADRVEAVADFVEYVPAAGAAGVRWAADTVVTTTAARVVRAVVRPGRPSAALAAGDTLRPLPAISPDAARRDWLLVVGRDSAGHVLSTVGMSGGRTTAACAGRPMEAIVMGGPLDPSFAGAGVFSLDGEVRGLVVRCDARLLAIPPGEVLRLLAAVVETDDRAAAGLGLDVAVGDTLAAAYARASVGSDAGLLVVAVRRGGPADRAGLRVGDLLVTVNGEPATERSATSLRGRDSGTVAITRLRGRRRATVSLAPAPVAATADSTAADAFGIGVVPPAPDGGVPIREVRPGSGAAAAGLRAGDRLLRVAEIPVTSAAQASRLLAAASMRQDAPTLLVVARDGIERGLLVAATRPPADRPAGAPAGASR